VQVNVHLQSFLTPTSHDGKMSASHSDRFSSREEASERTHQRTETLFAPAVSRSNVSGSSTMSCGQNDD
jgi:hypothetical protein